MSRRRQANEDTEEGFLRRWSRRKAGPDDSEPGNGAPSPAPEAPVPERTVTVPAPAESAPAGEEPSAESGERIMTDEDMPDLDTIDEATDMSGFFSPGVSETLRAQALRRLFRLPKFNVTDGLDDYNEDYRNFAALGDMVTSDMRQAVEGRPKADHGAQESDQAPADDEGRPVEGSEAREGGPEVAAGETERGESDGAEASEGEERDAGERAHTGVDT